MLCCIFLYKKINQYINFPSCFLYNEFSPHTTRTSQEESHKMSTFQTGICSTLIVMKRILDTISGTIVNKIRKKKNMACMMSRHQKERAYDIIRDNPAHNL